MLPHGNQKLLVLSALSSYALAGSTCPDSTFCVDATVSATEVCFTVNSGSSGWAGIGIGTSTMAGSEMYVGWKNTTGGYTVSNFNGKGHSKPPVGTIATRSTSATSKSFAKLSFAFCRPLNSGISVSGTQKFIYASSSTAPTGNLDTNAANFDFHNDAYGAFSFDPTSSGNSGGGSGGPILKPSDGLPIQRVHLIHGILMWIAWVISPFAGIFIARYMKQQLGHTWFKLHAFLMGIVTIGLSVVSFIFILLFRPLSTESGSGLETAHVVMGLTVLIGMLIQGYLGHYADKMFSPERTSIPWWDRAHWYLGRGLFLLALVNVYVGILVFEDNGNPVSIGYKIGHFVIVVVGVLAFVYGEIKIGQFNHISPE